MLNDPEQMRKLRWVIAAIGAVAIPAALILGTWDRQETLPVQYREAGTDRNLLGTPIGGEAAPVDAEQR
ncbi:MAG: hypothetical protein ACR2J8_12405 [Thermomicrobiales bacterium]